MSITTNTSNCITAGTTAPTVPARSNRRHVSREVEAAQLQDAERQAQAQAEADAALRAEYATTAAHAVDLWTRCLNAASNLASVTQSRSEAIYHSFARLGLVADRKDTKGASLKASLLLCNPERLASLPASLDLAIVRATISAWESATAKATSATDEHAQRDGKALVDAMAKSFYSASYTIMRQEIDAARAAQRKDVKAKADARDKAISARAAALESASKDDAHPLAWLINAYVALDAAVIAHAGEIPLADLREYVVDLAYASRRATVTPAPAPAPAPSAPAEPTA